MNIQSTRDKLEKSKRRSKVLLIKNDFEYLIGIDLGIHTQDKETAAICKRFSDGSVQILDITHNVNSLRLKEYHPLTVIGTEKDIEILKERGILKQNASTRIEFC